MTYAVISAGYNNFHLIFAAAEAEKHKRLNSLLCGPYPTQKIRRFLQLSGAGKNKKIARFLNRHEEIRDETIKAYWLGELISKISLSNQIPISESLRTKLKLFAFSTYGHWATKHVRQAAATGGRIYHYRAGFGGQSVDVAKQAGMITLCDHSIAHPSLLSYLVENNGKFPEQLPQAQGFWTAVLEDIKRADHILVNSDFVRQTFALDSIDSKKISVIYQGIENKFLDRLPSKRDYFSAQQEKPLHLLFAGNFGSRKGAEVLIAAFQQLASQANITLNIAGTIEPHIRRAYPEFWQHPKVNYLSLLSQQELANAMLNADVFVFPSLAEGSARVIFEALAAGCFVITTSNSGSIVEQNVHGYLVDPGNAGALSSAIIRVLDNPDCLARVGKHNWSLMRTAYSQNDYGNQLIELYSSLLDGY